MSFTKIGDKLYLGSKPTLEILNKLNINVVFNVARENKINCFKDCGFDVYNFEWDDFPEFNIFIDGEIEKVEEVLNNLIESDKIIYVHCLAGASRSPTLIIFHYMKRYNMTYIDSYSLIKKLRPNIDVNPEFCDSLSNWCDNISFSKMFE